MGTSYSTLIASVRLHLRETSADEWKDAQIATYLTRSERGWMAPWLGSLRNSGRFIQSDTMTLAASTETISMTTTGTPPAAFTYEVEDLRYIDMQVAGGRWVPARPLREGDENQVRGPTTPVATTLSVPSHFIRGDNLHFLPISGGARTLRIVYGWLPATKTKAGTAQTPTQYDDILILRSVYDALGPVGEREQSFEAKYALRLGEIESMETDRISKGPSLRVQNVTKRSLFGRMMR